MKSILLFLKPGIPKRYLMFVAGSVWTIAGGILLTKGVDMLMLSLDEMWIKLIISFPLGILFYIFLFSKIFKKHSERIIAIKNPKPCFFSFFNWKAYLMMGSMISLGIFLRKSGIVSPRYLSVVYITMAIPLTISAMMFFMEGLRSYSMLKNEKITN